MSQVRRLLHRLGGRDPSDDADLPDAAPLVDLRPLARDWKVQLPLARGTASRDAVPQPIAAVGTVPMPGPELPPDDDEYEELVYQLADDAVTPVDRSPPAFLWVPAPAPLPPPPAPPAPPAPLAARADDAEGDDEWEEVIARARLAAGSIPPPVAMAAAPEDRRESDAGRDAAPDDEEWEWAMALARARLAEPAPAAAAPRAARQSARDSGRSSSSMKA